MDKDLKDITNYLEHDGSQIMSYTFPDPIRRRGFSIIELMEYAIHNGHQLLYTEPSCFKYLNDLEIKFPFKHFQKYLKTYQGIICGVVNSESIEPSPHAVVWDGFKIIDPDGTQYPYDPEKFEIEIFIAFLDKPIVRFSDQ